MLLPTQRSLGIEGGGSLVGHGLEGSAEYIGRMLSTLFRQLSDAIPSQCLVCRRWPARPVCEGCARRFAQPQPRCRTCALPVPGSVLQCGACLRQAPPLDACLAAVGYAYPWSSLIIDFKFQAQTGYAASLALLMRSAPWVEPALDAASALIPMPLSRQRLQDRGYNQAELLARQLAPAKVRDNLLLRVRDTPAQSALPREERMRNVQGAFAIEPLKSAQLRGARLVLVDDVMTSGASLHAAALTLKAAGASQVSALVLARTE